MGFGAGLLASAVAIALAGGHAGPRAMAQAQPAPTPQPPAELYRYQVFTWAYPATAYAGNGLVPASHGAYLLDTATGQLWSTRDDEGLRRVGAFGAR
jgi:hypothetical protein